MEKKTLSSLTLGCSKNTVDSEHVLAALSSVFTIVGSGEASDVFLINTCSFIADAKEESINAILEAVELKKSRKYKELVVFGCLPQRYASQMPELIPEVDAWFGARDFKPLLEYFGVDGDIGQSSRLLSTPSHYAYLKISEGCDRRCSYCAIPFIRGAHRSVPMEKLVEEAVCLASRGVKELIVIAQDSTYYGLDLYGKRSLAALLRALSGIDGIEWIRLHYSYPSSFPDDVLEEMARNPKICKYIDIPLQHISSSVLEKMHRGIDEEQTRSLVDKMRTAVPGVVLRTTMIVGHPGESEEDFEKLLEFVSQARFERLGAFAYSEEEDTYSALHYRDDIPDEIKRERLDRLMSLQQEISLECNRKRLGTRERVIVDSYEDGILICRGMGESPDVDGEILVRYDSSVAKLPPEELTGSFIEVEINGADAYDLSAEMTGI